MFMSKELTVVTGKMRQSYAEEEKRRIVAESYQSGLSLNKFAARAGIAPPTLCLWRKQFKSSCALQQDILVQSDDNLTERVKKLESENRTLRMVFGQKLIELEMARISQ